MKKLKIVSCILIIFFSVSLLTAKPVKIFIRPFKNSSRYKTQQKIENYIRYQFINKIKDIRQYLIINTPKQADWIIEGIIKDLNVRVYGLSSLKTDSYQKLKSYIKIDLRLISRSQAMKLSAESQKDMSDPNSIGSKEKVKSIMKMNPYSSPFSRTILNSAIMDVLNQLIIKQSFFFYKKAYGYITRITDTRDNFIFINRSDEVLFKVNDTYRIRTPYYINSRSRLSQEIIVDGFEADLIRLRLIKNKNIFKADDQILFH